MCQQITLFSCFLWGSILLIACGESRKPDKYIIPNGYVGWVKVYYDIQDAPPLPIKDGYVIYRIPLNGVLKTSSKLTGGVAVDKYCYDTGGNLVELESTGWGEGGMVWAGYTGSGGEIIDGKPASYLGFFVGTEEELKKYGFNMKDKIGPNELRRSKLRSIKIA